MSFGKIGILLSKMFTAVQSIEPTGSGLVIFEKLGWVLIWIWEGICLGIYNIIRWLLALVDFMQYFVQKLIGLDYWLNRTYYTLEGAIESDLIFGFLYNDTVQKVFRAMMGIFFVLLIIFTIYAIIKSEWEHINGTGKGGKFGDGTGNSKTRIFRNSLKAVALVLIFPIILMVGIISANAILASLIKALNIDTSSTLGGQLFQIASQNANKYEKYAHDTDGRTAVSDEVTFYVKNHKYITLGAGGSTDVVTMVDTYEDYLKEISGAKKYTVRSCFDRIGGVFDQGYDKKNFYGYIARLTVKGEPFFIMATCSKEANAVNSKEAMYYYLRCVLQVPIVNKYDAYGFGGHSIVKEYMNGDPDWGFISGANLNEIGFDDVEQAMRNTWNYASIYKETYAFEDSLDYMVTRKGGVSLTDAAVTGATGKSILEAANLGVSSAKVMFNSPLVSTYFDGGEKGIVQMQSEYLVMAEVIDFINQNNFRLHILDINSPLISWAGEGSYRVETKWINPAGIDITDGDGGKKHSIPFVVGYSDSCNETEMGNVLYFGDNVGGNQSELKGAKYIMCIKVEGKSNAKYIPLVNNKTFTDPVTGKMYNFKSSYYSASYQGVVLAKGLLDSSATNAYRGEPTYFVSSTKTKPTLFNKSGNYVGDNDPYYYEMVISGGFNQFGENGELVRSYNGKAGDPATSGYDFRVDGLTCSLSATNYYYDLRRHDVDDDGTYEKEIYKVYKIATGEEVAEEDRETIASPSADIIRSLQIQLKNLKTDPNDMVTAEYGGQSNGDYHLFKFSYEGFAYYFMLKVDTASQTVSVLTYSSIDNTEGSWEVLGINNLETHPNSLGYTLNALTKKYYIKYDFDQDGDTAYNESLNGDVGFTPDYFAYAKTVTKKTGTNTYATKTVYQTVDMESFTVGDTNKTLYFNLAFNTTSKYLVTIEDGKIKFATAYEPTAQDANDTGMGARGSDAFVQSSQFSKFYLYDFYHAYLGTENATTHIIEGAVREYDPEKSGTAGISGSAAARPDEDDDDWFFECKIDDDDFSFPAKESYLHLYDGNRYVATIYKVAGNDPSNEIGTMGQLPTATTYILYNDTIYYNIRTQNAFKSEAEMGTYFDNVKQSMVIRCVRDNRTMVFFDFDFWFISLIPSLKIRNNIGFFSERLEREWIGQEFYITDGIQFDYFFEGKASLITFYIPSKISYWIILVASALMIKVLGTAVWGVIKRIYEITLFFIAAPAVASTIPLDDGQKFTTQIQQPLVRKVLGTYGTMLGINVFFILLYPVKSLSQIFTPEDIATSNNYFLKNFFSIFGREFQAKMLNLYVYILFVLVAFTMISALPGVIAQMLGAEDVHKNGEQTKKQAASDVKGAMDHVSGKNLMEGGKKAWEGAKNSLPGKAIALGAKGVKGLKDKFSKGVPDDDDGDKEETPKSRTDEEMAQDDAEVQGAIDTKFNEMAGDKFGGKSYADVMANGTEEEKAAAQEVMNQATAEVGKEIGAGDNDNMKAAFERVTAAKEEDAGEKTPEDKAESAAEQKFNSSTEEIAQQVVGASGDASKMEANAIVNMAGADATANKVVAAAMGATAGADGKTDLTAQTFGADAAGQERKKQAVLSTMNEEERAKFDKMNTAQQEAVLSQYDVSSTMDADGKVSMAVTHARDAKGNAIANAEATAVGAETANAVMKDVAKETAEKDPSAMQNAIENTEGGKEAASKAVADNIATSIDFSTAGTEGQDSVAEMVINNVLDNADDAKNGAVIDNAMLAFLQDPANKKIMKEFQKLTGLSDADMKNQDLVLKNIDVLRAGGTGIKQLGITADSYKDKMGGALEQAVQSGQYSISAWELFNSQKDGAAEAYIDQVSAENMVRNNDEVELEKEKSAEGLEAIIQKMIEQLLAGKDYTAIAKAEYDKEHGAGAFDKLDPAEQNKLIAATETKEKEQAEAQARGQALFTAFTQNADGNSTAVTEMLKAAMGIDSETGVNKAIADAVTAGSVTGKDVDELNKVNGYNNEDIAQAIKSLQLLGQDVSKENIAAYLERAKADPDAHNKELLEAMQNDTTGDVDKSKMYQMLGGGDVLDEEQKQKLAEQTAANGMMALTPQEQEAVKQNLAQAEFGKDWKDLTPEEQAKITEKANGMSLYEAQAVAAGKSQQEAFTELREESKKRKVIDEALASNPDIPVEQLMEAAGNDPETAKYIQEMYAQRMSAVTDEDKATAQKAAEADVIAEQTKDAKGKGADINTEAGRKAAYAKMVGGDAAEAEAKLNAEVESKFTAKIKDQIGSNIQLQAQRDAWLQANPNKTQEDFVAHLAAKAKGGDAATLKSLGFVDESGNASIKKVNEVRAEFEREVVVGMAKETYDGFDADVAESASKKVEARNRELIEGGKGAEILKTAEILDKGNASGTYGKFVQEANAEYQRLYGKDKNLAKEDPLARAAFLTQYMQKRGFTLEADDAHTVELAGKQAEATGKAAADKAEAELKAKNPNATQTEIAEARQNAAIFAQITANPAQFSEMVSVMESYDGGEKGNAVALKLKRTVLEKTYDDYKSKGVSLSIAKDPEKMSADERKRFEFNKGILQQEMRNNNDVVGNLFKNTNIFNQEAMIQVIAQSSGMKFDENIGTWIDADGKALTDENGNKIGKDNMLALKGHLDNTAIANYMNSHEDAKDKLLNLGAQNMMLTMNKETQDIKKADAVLSSSYLRNEVSTKVLMDAGLNDVNGKLDETKVKDLIMQMLKANGRDAEATSENINKNFEQYKTELALHDLSRAKDGVVGGRNADAFVKATAALENDPKFASALNREVTRVIDPASYDPETSTKEFFASHSISDFRADDGSEINNLADALNAFHKEGFGGFKKGAKNVIGDAKGGMTDGGIVGGFKTMFLGGYGEGKNLAGVIGNDGERGGIVGGLESIAVGGVLGSARNLLTLKAIRSGAKALKERKQVKLDNGQDISYIKYKTGAYELDENGRVKRDEKGNAILVKKHKLSGAEDEYAKEQFAKEKYVEEQQAARYAKQQYEKANPGKNWESLDEPSKQAQIQEITAKAGFAQENYAKERIAQKEVAFEKWKHAQMLNGNYSASRSDFESIYNTDANFRNEIHTKVTVGAAEIQQYAAAVSKDEVARFSEGFDASKVDAYSDKNVYGNIEQEDKQKYVEFFKESTVTQKDFVSDTTKAELAAEAEKLSPDELAKYSAGYENASSTKKAELAAGLKKTATVSRQEVVEQKAKQLFGREEYAREKYKQVNGTDSGFTQLTEAQKAMYYEAFDNLDESSQNKYSAGFDKSSKKQDFIDMAEKKVTKKDVAAANEAATKAKVDAYAKKSAVEKRARETFAQDEYAKEQYAKEHGTTEGFDKLSAAEKSQYTAGYAKLSKKEQAKYSAGFDSSAEKQNYMKAAEGSVTAKEIDAASKAEKNAEYVSGFKRFRRVSNAVLDNTAIGTLLKQPLIGVAKMGTGIGLGVGKMGTGIGLGVARMATKSYTSTIGNLGNFVTRNRRLFGSKNTEMLEMVQEARKDKLIMKEVGENASTADIARYLDRNKVAGENIKNRVHAKKAREIANADATFADEMIKAGVDLTDDAAVAAHLSNNKAHRNRVNKSFKQLDDGIALQKVREIAASDATFADNLKKVGVDINDDKAVLAHLSINRGHREKVEKAAGLNFGANVQSDRKMNIEAKQHAYTDDELTAKLKNKEIDVDVTDDEVAAQALKSSYIKSKLGPNATIDDVKNYLDSHQNFKKNFINSAKIQAIRDGKAGTVLENGKKVKVDNVLDTMLLTDKKATKAADGTVVATDDVVSNYFSAIPGEGRIYKKVGKSIGNAFASATGSTFRGVGKVFGAAAGGVSTFFAGKKIGTDFSGSSVKNLGNKTEHARVSYAREEYAKEQYVKDIYIKNGGKAEDFDAMTQQDKQKIIDKHFPSGQSLSAENMLKYSQNFDTMNISQKQEYLDKFDKLSNKERRKQINKPRESIETSVAREAYAKEIYAKEQFVNITGKAVSEFDKLTEVEKQSFVAGFDKSMVYSYANSNKFGYVRFDSNSGVKKKELGGLSEREYIKSVTSNYANKHYYDSMAHKDRNKIEGMTIESFTAGKKGLIDDATKQAIMENMVGGAAEFAKVKADPAKMKALEAKYNKLTVADARKLSGNNESINASVAKYARMAGSGQRAGFTQSYLAKGVMAGLKGAGIGVWSAIKSPVTGFTRTFVGGAKDSMGQRHWGDSGLAKLGKGIGKTAVVGYNAVIFKTVKGLPKMCTQYVNWNKVLEHKIQAIKRDTTLTREQKEKQIKIYESQKIYLKKPDAYANMSTEEQGAFDLAQDKLKRQAFTDPALASFVKKMERAERAGNPAGVGIPGELGYAGAPSRSRKEKHLNDFNEARAISDRYRATAAMRNKERDFGDDFEKFARTFMSRKRYFDMIKRYKIKTAIQYQMLNAQQKEKERRKREDAINAQLARINRVLAKKVAKDNKVSVSSYMVSRGMSPEAARFRDGSFRYRDIQNAIPQTGLGSRAKQVSKGTRSNAEVLQIQNETININNMMNEFIKFSSTFKGTSAEFAKAFKEEFKKFGPYAQKIYDKYASGLKGLGRNALGLGTLDKSPIAVQQRKIMEGLAQELSKCKRRITMDGKIPASQAINNMFVGKTFTGATTQAELALHKQQADELSRLLKLIKDQRNHVSYESLTHRLAGVHLADFMRKNPKINNLSEEAKKNKLEQYFRTKLDKALKVVHNDSAYVAEKHNLERLNGRRVNRADIDHSRHSRTMSDAMKTQSNPVYQNLVREANSTTEKHKLEKANLDDLLTMLRKLQSMPKTPKNINEIVKLEKAINVSKVKLKTLDTLMKNAQKRKRDYEQAFASTQIKEAKANTRVLAYNNSTSVFDRYVFQTTKGTEVVKGTVEAKEVQMLVNRYISQYKQTIQSMINSSTVQANSELKRYVEGMKRKFTADFGRNMKYTRDVKDELTRYIERIKLMGDKKDKTLLTELEEYVQKFNISNEAIETEMKKLGIDIKSIRLKK